jgi:hypothetical protein
MNLNKPKQENSVSNIWAVQENLIHFYKMVALGSSVAALFILIFTITTYFRDPIVVVRTGSAQEFYATARSEVSVDKKDIDNFIREYLKALYVWESFDPDTLASQIKPYSEEALVPKVLATQTQKFGRIGDKKISQDISFVKVTVLETKVTCSFLRILKVEGIPLVVPTQLSFALIQGSRTTANPMGVYVAGINETENAK